MVVRMRFLRNPFPGAMRRVFRGSPIRECLAIFPVIRRQLEETSRQVEDSVVSVCGNFTGIAARAREAITESSTLMDGETALRGATVEGAIETSRQTIASLLERLEHSTRLSALAVSSMEEVSRTVTGIEELLGQVQRISFTNKLIALNAKIEAVHVGELGSGFEVVADEISRQAEQSTELVNGITGHIQTMRGRVDSAAGDLREFLAEGRQKLDQSHGEAEGALTILLRLHQRTQESLQRKTEENAKLAGDIAAAVVGLQFQDRVKQRVDHVIEALEKMEQAIGGSGANLLADVHSSYTMASEREAHDGAAIQATAATSEPAEMEVELF
jgi:methyl-accepting chemotaxis protein